MITTLAEFNLFIITPILLGILVGLLVGERMFR